jgi:hypothetical protein
VLPLWQITTFSGGFSGDFTLSPAAVGAKNVAFRIIVPNTAQKT